MQDTIPTTEHCVEVGGDRGYKMILDRIEYFSALTPPVAPSEDVESPALAAEKASLAETLYWEEVIKEEDMLAAEMRGDFDFAPDDHLMDNYDGQFEPDCGMNF